MHGTLQNDLYFQRQIELNGNTKHLSKNIIINGKKYKLGCSIIIPIFLKNKTYKKQFVKIVGLNLKYNSIIDIDDDDNQIVNFISGSGFVLIGDLKRNIECKIYVSAREDGDWNYAHETSLTGITDFLN